MTRPVDHTCEVRRVKERATHRAVAIVDRCSLEAKLTGGLREISWRLARIEIGTRVDFPLRRRDSDGLRTKVAQDL